MKTITLIWANGGEEVVTCDYWTTTHEGRTLVLQMGRDQYRYIPMSALREWRVG